MDINAIQRQIVELKTKFEIIGLTPYYDDEYRLKIKKGNYDSFVTFNTKDNDNSLIICISNDGNSCYTLSVNDVERIIGSKEKCDSDIYERIVDYLFFRKENEKLFELIDILVSKNAQVMHEMIENNEINETENEVNEVVVNRNQEISNYVIEYLNKELSNYGAIKFSKNKRYYISEDNEVAVLVMRSKRYDRGPYKYWYTFHKYQKDVLEKYNNSYIMLYFDDKDECILIEAEKLYTTLSKLGKTQNGDSIGWHLHIQDIDGVYSIRIPYEGLLNINQDGSLEMQPSKKVRNKNQSNNYSDDTKFEKNLEEQEETTSSVDDNVTLKITYDDFKVIKFKNK